eukprot:TRINITY_DN3039_c0_g1_i1.p1 TRINITY_DN3039_c0_g1~~TRINITY_DN3039_c0_g1_i1.p1  ORF type:complete len:344 (-),score=108.74 TRINITY_DN3039_c0_g1_i1:980-2011(-)
MKAVRIHKEGGPEVLTYEEVPIPTLKPGEILVKNEAVGVNYIDTYIRSGLKPYNITLPSILGKDGAGYVHQIGEGVTGFSVGDHVVYPGSSSPTSGSYAEYTPVIADRLYKIPDGISSQEGVTLMISGLTAHAFSTSTYPNLGKEHTVLIHAGAGSLGQLLIQICKLLGAKVITTVSTKEKADLVKSLGADHVINYTQEDFKVEVKKLTDNKGVNVVYDSVGATTWEKSLDSLAPLGYLVLCGNASGPVPPIDPFMLTGRGSLFVTRPTLAHYVLTPEAFKRRCDELFKWLKEGKIKVSAATTFPLKDVAKAHEAIQSRGTTGKLSFICFYGNKTSLPVVPRD